ncbi:MAG: anthranilate phosphoribosyltransferase [Nitrospinae bacterium]|nr:anthranilate phosphoribosyltransferase [Nitrospinota bacterium]
MKIQSALHKILQGQGLSEEEMMEAMDEIMEGQAGEASIAAFLTALRMKGETVAEIVGAAKVMRRKAETLDITADPVVDTCGTGGDRSGTFNISTTAAFVVAGAGIAVAKHGNRAVSSASGSADVLRCLGVNIEADRVTVKRCVEQAGIGFLFAPLMHKAMKHAAIVRRELGFRTIFNLLGPLTNPARAHAQVVGVYDDRWTTPIAQALRELGCRRALVVHGEDGLDEITLTDGTYVADLDGGEIREYSIAPEDFGFQRCSAEELQGGIPEENAVLTRDLLKGAAGAKRDIVLLNAAAGIVVSGKADSLEQGLELARRSLDSGAAYRKLQDLIQISNS